MGLGSCTIVVTLVVSLFCFWSCCAAIDTISSSQFIKDPEAIESAGNIFKLGFFSPVNSTNRYVGIWYNSISVTTPIWVANRNKPLNDSCGIMTISKDGNLVVLDGQRDILWSSNTSIRVGNSSALLTDNGNLVLLDNNGGNTIWESFQQPSHLFLRYMKLSTNKKTGEKIQLNSWKSPSDPSIGSFSTGIDLSSIPQFFIWSDNRPYWRSGPWNGQVFIGIPSMHSVYFNGFNLAEDRYGTFSLTLVFPNDSLFLNYVLTSEGELAEKIWDERTKGWEYDWKRPETQCDIYGKCGPFGSCNAQYSSICSCLTGFEPKNVDEWSKGNWTSGCIRRRPLQCERIKNGGEVGQADRFLKLGMMKVPDFARWSSSTEQECQDNCLNDCSCVAYSYYTGFGCMSWNGNLTDIQKFSSGGADLYIRLAYSELGKKRNIKIIISMTVIAGVITMAILVFFLWSWRATHSGWKRKSGEMLLPKRKNTRPTFLNGNELGDNKNQEKFQELPLLSLQNLATATDNFDESNKLGQGGFGPVYKGKLPDGQEIAVKRLSSTSRQGPEEFMNEAMVISKLQHRNLVRLLGCCIEREEKMLVYECMPNKSLDAFIFDPLKKELLGWKQRFNIIEGICRGLLYLHRDSRLRIIHRDLKASNILLDKELNPKISDFGLARIFGGNQDQAETRRVVGTYGYMSPEYAMEGRFSEKSDVFSFGILLLEIVSGRRNTSFDNNEQALSLSGLAWKLWNEGNIAALVDPVIFDPCFQVDIFRCIHLGLLCVQEFAKDRPTMSTVISVLNSEIVDLPTPKQPAFAERQIGLDTGSSQQNQKRYSINNVTVTVVDGR